MLLVAMAVGHGAWNHENGPAGMSLSNSARVIPSLTSTSE